MACYHPLKGWRARRPSKNGGYAIVFNVREGFADLPVIVPCGQCVGCRLERSRQWAIRCVHEAQLHDKNCFITLTYSDEDLEKNGHFSAGAQNYSLHLKDFQDFLKRLRKNCGKFRYFHAGEYGGTTGRPHYHACLFGFDFPDKKFLKFSREHPLFTSGILDKTWGHGFAWIGEVSFESAAYVARYIMKKITGEAAASHYKGLTPEYTTMSRRPGIGAGWLEKYKSDVFPSDEVVMRGHASRPPRFYTKKYELTDPIKFNNLKLKRRASIDREKNTDDALRVSEEVKLASIKNLKRSL